MTREEFLKEVDNLTTSTQENLDKANQPLKDLHKQFGKKNLAKQNEDKPE